MSDEECDPVCGDGICSGTDTCTVSLQYCTIGEVTASILCFNDMFAGIESVVFIVCASS